MTRTLNYQGVPEFPNPVNGSMRVLLTVFSKYTLGSPGDDIVSSLEDAYLNESMTDEELVQRLIWLTADYGDDISNSHQELLKDHAKRILQNRFDLETGEFFPDGIFLNSEKGVWFDPSDLSTLWQDSGRTTPVADYGDPVGAMNDKSGNGVNATQATAAARPIYGRVPATGRRNLLLETETLDSGTWGVNEATITPEGDGVARVTPSTSSSVHTAHLTGFTDWADNSDHTVSAEFKATDPGVFKFVRLYTRTKDTKFPSIYVDLTTGAKTEDQSPISSSVTDMGDGWYRLTVTANAGTGSSLSQLGVNPSTSNTSEGRTFAGDGSAALLVRKPQAEVGTSATDYQRVGNEYDVSEAGVRSLAYLFDDGVDDALEATLPDLGSDATVAYASDQGVTIQTGQTIGAGAFDVLRDDMLFGMVVIDRALTTAETARLTAWLNHKAGDYA